MENSKNFRILSLDGGGIRGMLTATLLVTLENELKAINPEYNLTNCFDFFAGTSTGSIIACGLANGMTAIQILKFYQDYGQAIFKELDLKKFSNVWPEVWRRIKEKDPSLPLFEEERLESVLKQQEIFPETLLFKDLPKPTLVTSYDTYNREAVIFVSRGTVQHNEDTTNYTSEQLDKKKLEDAKYKARYATLPVWQVCRSSSAAPVAFAGYLLKDKAYLDALTDYDRPDNDRIRRGDLIKKTTTIPQHSDEKCIPLIDGGVVANNPALCAIAEAIENGKPLDKIFVASFGTGQVNRRISAEEATTWGGFDWVNIHNQIPLMDVFSDGSSDVTDYTAKKLLKDNYKRIQPVITSDISTFQADEANLTALSRAADHYLNHCGGK